MRRAYSSAIRSYVAFRLSLFMLVFSRANKAYNFASFLLVNRRTNCDSATADRMSRVPLGRWPVRLKPFHETANGLHEPSAQRCQFVLNARRHFGKDVVREQPAPLKTAQRGCQNSSRKPL